MLGGAGVLLTSVPGMLFRGGPLLDSEGSHQLLTSSHVRERDKALLRSIMVGGVWNGFLLGKVRGEVVPCRFCGGVDGDGHLFLLVELRENPEVHDVMRMDKRHWPRCLLWDGWLPLLAARWAATAAEGGANKLECSSGAYSSRLLVDREALAGADWVAAACWLPADPNVWTDGSLFLDDVSGASSSGSGVYAHLPAHALRHRSWVHFDDLGMTTDGSACSCRSLTDCSEG